jgi:hypothetical protein
MPADLLYVRGDTTAQVTPDALRLMLRQAGMPANAEGSGDEIDLVLPRQDAVLLLTVEAGFVSEIAVEQTFVDEPGMSKVDYVCEFLESMGWEAVEG